MMSKTPAAPLPLRDRLRRPLMVGVPALALLVGGALYLSGGGSVDTDDAYIQAARTVISSDVAGRVVAVEVKDNQTVHKGDVLFRLDERPFRIAEEEAEAQLAAARLRIEAQKATYRQRQADLQLARNTLDYASKEFDRQQRLLGPGIASRAQYDQAVHALQVARQQVAAAEQQASSTLAELGGSADIAPEIHPAVRQAQAALDRARLNLSYTVISAPDDGVVAKVDQLQAGDYINTAQPVFSLVSASRVWVEANFKETELTHMRPGQKALVRVDTYPGHALEARVASLSPGTGSAFSLLPPENATGNWVKVVQRLPVRLQFDGLPKGLALRSGMSLDVEVETGHSRFGSAFAAEAPKAEASTAEGGEGGK